AGQAAWNMRMISTTPPTGKTLGATHSDLAFSGKYAIMGNYNGFELYDISNPAKPVLAQSYLCPASQNDVSIFKNLLFMSSEVIKVPLAAPQQAAIVSSPRIFQDLPVPPRNAERDASDQRDREAAAAAAAATGRAAPAGPGGGRGRGNQGPPTGPNQCHDITV